MEQKIKIISYRGTPGKDGASAPDLKPFVQERLKAPIEIVAKSSNVTITKENDIFGIAVDIPSVTREVTKEVIHQGGGVDLSDYTLLSTTASISGNLQAQINTKQSLTTVIAKAIACGATMVMAGNLFAGFDESAGDVTETNGKLVKEYYGSASQFNKGEYKNVEGKKILVDYKGSMQKLLNELKEDLQSSISYAGGRDLNALLNCKFINIK